MRTSHDVLKGKHGSMVVAVVMGLTSSACASSQSSEAFGGRPLVASVEAVPLPALDVPKPVAPPAPEAGNPSAGALLKRAFELFRHDKNEAAASAFRAAISTGNLNDAGKALAYWHIYVAEQTLGQLDRGHDALASFVVVAEDVLDVRGQLRYAEDDSGDFVDRFDLKRRLARARAILSATWAIRAGWFGRSVRAPVPVHNSAEMNYFLELAPPCAEARDRRIASSKEAGTPDIEQVTLTCHGEQGRADYFFQVLRTP